MRFCPWCSAENASEAASCAACGRRLPPLPTRKQKGQPTGVVTTMTGVAPVPGAAPAASTATADDERRALRTSLLPPPTAVRRKGATGDVRGAGMDARRRDDLIVPAATPPPEPDNATRPIDASWLIETSGYDAELDGPAAEPPRPAPAISPAVARSASPGPTTLGPVPPPRRKQTTLPPPIPTGPPPSQVTPPPAPPASSPAAAAAPAPAPAAPVQGSPVAGATMTPAPTPSATKLPGRDHTNLDPPPTRIVRSDEMADRPFTPPQVLPIPGVPEPGLVNAARYSVTFARARWQRRRAVKLLQVEIKSDTDALDVVLGTLGREARGLAIDNRVLAAENNAITEAEKKKDQLIAAAGELVGRRNEENAKFEEIERERTIKLTEAEKVLEEAQRELGNLEAQRRGLRDKRKELERRQKAYLQAAEERDGETGNTALGSARDELRRLAEGHRREAASLDPERQDLERRLAALDRPIAAAQAKVEAARGELDQQRRSLNDAREGHRHRLAELEAEQNRKSREQDLLSAEIHRRLVTLGTLINLHRVERPEFGELYERIDRLRSAINARTTEIDRLTAERDAYDRPSLLRGYAVLGGVIVAVITLVVIILAIA